MMKFLRSMSAEIRFRWRLATIVFVVTTLASILSLPLIGNLLLSHERGKSLDPTAYSSLGTKVDYTENDVSPLRPPSTGEEYISMATQVAVAAPLQTNSFQGRATILRKLEKDTKHLQGLDIKLRRPVQRAPYLTQSNVQEMQVQTPRELRNELAACLINLLKLEKIHTEEDPELALTRERISTLQKRLEAPSRPYYATSPDQATAHPDRKSPQMLQESAAMLDAQEEIRKDLQQLSYLTSKEHTIDLKSSDQLFSSPDHVAPKQNGSERKLTDRRFAITQGGTLAVSLALSVLASLIAISVASIWDKSIRDEAGLLAELPATVKLIGNIPRMGLK
jgi:hypothetical protein